MEIKGSWIYTNLFELVDTEDTPGIFSVRSSLLAVACAVTGISISFVNKNYSVLGKRALLDGKVLILEPLAIVQGRQWLLGGSNEVLVGRLILALSNLIQLLVKLLELRSLRHEILEHELRGLVRCVALVEEELQTIVDQSQVEEKTVASQAVSTVANNLDTTLWVISIETSQHFVVGEAAWLLHFGALGGPCLDQLVVCLQPEIHLLVSRRIRFPGLKDPYLIVAHGHRFVDVVSNRANLPVALNLLGDSSFLQLLLLCLELCLLCEQLGCVFLVLRMDKHLSMQVDWPGNAYLLLHTNCLLDSIDLRTHLCDIVPGYACQ